MIINVLIWQWPSLNIAGPDREEGGPKAAPCPAFRAFRTGPRIAAGPVGHSCGCRLGPRQLVVHPTFCLQVVSIIYS